MFVQLFKYGAGRYFAVFKIFSVEYIFNAYWPLKAINIHPS